MLVGRIGNIKTVFLESKEVSKLKGFSYAPLAKENVDKAIEVLSSVSSALFVANITMNATKNKANTKDEYISAQELIKILEEKIRTPLGQYYESFSKSCLNNFGLLKKESVPYVFKLINSSQEVPHPYVMESIKDGEGNIQASIIDWYDSIKDDMDFYNIREAMEILKDSNGICDPNVLPLFRPYQNYFQAHNFPVKGEVEFCKNEDGTFNKEKIDLVVKHCKNKDDYKYLNGAINQEGNLDGNLFSDILYIKHRWDKSIEKYPSLKAEYPFEVLLSYITKKGKYSKEITNIMGDFLFEKYNELILNILEHIQNKYGEISPNILKTFVICQFSTKNIDKLKKRNLSSEESTSFFKTLYKYNEKYELLSALMEHIVEGFIQAESPQDYKLLTDMLNDENLSSTLIHTYCNNLKKAYPLYYSEIPNDYIVHMYYKKDIPDDLETFMKYSAKFEQLQKLKTRILENPQQFGGLEYQSFNKFKAMVLNKFTTDYINLANSIDYLDNITLDYLIDNHLNCNKSSLSGFFSLTEDEKFLYNNLVNKKNNNGKEFTTKEKVGLIDILSIYKTNNIQIDYIYNMVEEKNIDTGKIKINFIKKVLEKLKFNPENISDERLASIGINNVILFTEFVAQNGEVPICKDILNGMNTNNFKNYILTKSKEYKRINTDIKKIFKANTLNYDLWLNPRKENEIKFVTVDNNKEALKQIATQIMEDINILIKTPAKSFIEKQLKEYVKNGVFIVPEKIYTNKNLFKKLIENLANTTEKGQLYQIWKRAKDNTSNKNLEKAENAKNILTILNHLKQKLKDIEQLSVNESIKECNWTIKMWDRNPIKDLFQGNYSTCCIGLGECNEEFMLQYLLNTTFNMIEITDNKTGETVGNALCYFAIVNSKPAFIIDNIEIKNSEKLSDNESINLRKAITQYAKNISKDVVGNSDAQIYLGNAYNDISTKGLKSSNKKLLLLGDFAEPEIYLDALGGYINAKFLEKNKTGNLYRLN